MSEGEDWFDLVKDKNVQEPGRAALGKEQGGAEVQQFLAILLLYMPMGGEATHLGYQGRRQGSIL